MKFILQRVSSASVTIDHTETRSIGPGLLIYVGISKEAMTDYQQRIDKFVDKVAHLKLFEAVDGKINASLHETGGEILLISNFTLHGRNKKGNQIDFSHAAGFAEAKEVYAYLCEQLTRAGLPYQAGEFGGYMEVASVVDGPVNIVLEY